VHKHHAHIFHRHCASPRQITGWPAYHNRFIGF
jgi:hypothetical protein